MYDRSSQLVLWLIALAVFAAGFLYNFNFVNLHFEAGAFLLDSGWFAYLFESGDFRLQNPKSISDISYYNHHFMPYVYLLSLLLHGVFGLSGVTVFAVHQGVAYGAISAFVFFLFRDKDDSWSVLAAKAGFIAVALLFNCILLFSIGYPHLEVAIFACVLAILVAAKTGRPKAVFVAALSVLLVREDGGFHAAAALSAIIVFHHFHRTDNFPVRAYALLAGFSVVASIALILVKAKYFPHYATISSNFTGTPAFSHLTWEFLIERIVKFVSNPVFMIVIAVTFFAFSITTDFAYLAMLFFYSPLILLQLIAIRDVIGKFELYYALPLFVLLIWPFYCIRKGSERSAMVTMLAIVGLAASTSIVQQSLGVVSAQAARSWFRPAEYYSAEIRSAIERELGRLENRGGRSSAFCATSGVLALVPNGFSRSEFRRLPDFPDKCETMMVFVDDHDRKSVEELRNRFVWHERVVYPEKVIMLERGLAVPATKNAVVPNTEMQR